MKNESRIKITIGSIVHFIGVSYFDLLIFAYLYFAYLKKYSEYSTVDICDKYIYDIQNHTLLDVLKTHSICDYKYEYISLFDRNLKLIKSKYFSEFLYEINSLNSKEVIIYLIQLLELEANEINLSNNLLEFIRFLYKTNIDRKNIYFLNFLNQNNTIIDDLIISSSKHITNVVSNNQQKIVGKILIDAYDFTDFDSFVFDYNNNVRILKHEQYDFVFSVFPWFVKNFNSDIIDLSLNMKYSYFDYALIELISSKINTDGIGITLIPESLFINQKFIKDRTNLLKLDIIDSIICLPKGAVDNYSGVVYILILRKESVNINCYNFSEYYKKMSNKKVNIDLNKFIEKYQKLDSNIFSRIKITQLKEMDYTLNIREIIKSEG